MNNTQKFFTKKNHLNDEGVALYVDALKLDRTAELPREILVHVEKCQRCKVQIMGVFDLVANQDYSRLGPHPFFGARVTTHREKGMPIYRIAAGFAIFVLLGVIAYFLGYLDLSRKAPKSETTLNQTVPLDTSAPVAKPRHPSKFGRHRTDTEAYAARFTESPNLESLVSGTLRSESVRVISPAIGESVGRRILFRWETEVQPPFTLKIVNNREKTVKEVTLSTPRYLLKERLADGLYYWKLVAGGELVCVGKFLVKAGEDRQ